MRVVIAIVTSIITLAANASPCDGIDRSLSDTRKAQLELVIAKGERVAKIQVLQSFKSGSWQIIYIENYVSDEPFLFYPSDPMITKPITAWSGAATIHEEKEMKAWALKNAPGIPEDLASCFAWHVTLGRAQ
jgi:hypothetical protein